MPIIHRKRRAVEEDSDSDSESVSNIQTSRRNGRASPSSSPERASQQQDSEENKDQLARKLVRYALSCEYARKPIKRAEINARVLGAQSRHFRDVFHRAQVMLGATFALSMEELPTGERVSLQQRRDGESGSVNTNAYVLVTVLPKRYRIPSILCPPTTDANEDNKDYDAICTMVVAIISLSGGTISEEKLDHSLFRKTRIPDPESTSALARMCREGFITKITNNSSGQTSVEYIVGPRGRIQIGEEGVKSFVKAVWADDDEGEEADLEKQLDRTLKLAKAPEKKADDETPAPAPKKRGRPPKRTQGSDEDMDEVDVVQDLDEDDEDVSDEE